MRHSFSSSLFPQTLQKLASTPCLSVLSSVHLSVLRLKRVLRKKKKNRGSHSSAPGCFFLWREIVWPLRPLDFFPTSRSIVPVQTNRFSSSCRQWDDSLQMIPITNGECSMGTVSYFFFCSKKAAAFVITLRTIENFYFLKEKIKVKLPILAFAALFPERKVCFNKTHTHTHTLSIDISIYLSCVCVWVYIDIHTHTHTPRLPVYKQL